MGGFWLARIFFWPFACARKVEEFFVCLQPFVGGMYGPHQFGKIRITSK